MGHVDEAGVVALEGDDDVAGGAVAVLGDDQVGLAGAGEISNVASYDGLKPDDYFFVEISRHFEEGIGIVKTSAEPFLVSAQAPCNA